MKSIVTPILFFVTLSCLPALSAQEVDEGKSPASVSVDANPTQQKTTPPTRVTADSSQWIDIEPSGAGAKFKMPTKPRYIQRMFSPVENEPPIKVHVHLCSFNSGAGAFVFSYHDLINAPTNQKEIDDTLNGAIIGSIANVAGKPIAQQTIRYRTNPGRAFTYLFAQNNQIFKVSARTFLVGNRQYQISALLKEGDFDEEIVEAYLRTFRLLEPKTEKENESTPETDLNSQEKSNDSVAPPVSEEDVESKPNLEDSPAAGEAAAVESANLDEASDH